MNQRHLCCSHFWTHHHLFWLSNLLLERDKMKPTEKPFWWLVMTETLVSIDQGRHLQEQLLGQKWPHDVLSLSNWPQQGYLEERDTWKVRKIHIKWERVNAEGSDFFNKERERGIDIDREGLAEKRRLSFASLRATHQKRNQAKPNQRRGCYGGCSPRELI